MTQKAWILVFGVFLVSFGLAFFFFKQRTSQTLPANLASEIKISLPTPTSTPTPTPRSVVIIFGGDMMFDRHIRQKAQTAGNYDFILAPLKPLLTSADLVVANLEGPVTDFDSISVNSRPGGPRNYTFTFDPVVPQTLARYNIKMVNLGNNHILNFGEKGLTQTLAYLDQAGVGWFGYVGNDQLKVKSEKLRMAENYVDGVGWAAEREIKSQKFLFLNFNQFTDQEIEPLLKYIRQRRSAVDWIIIMPHWDNEYQTTPAPITRQRAHRLIDTGADLIVGAHPHVISEIEDYKEKKIYYSLGNFVFDQYFEPAVRKGLLVKAKFSLHQPPKYQEIHTWLDTNGQTKLIND